MSLHTDSSRSWLLRYASADSLPPGTSSPRRQYLYIIGAGPDLNRLPSSLYQTLYQMSYLPHATWQTLVKSTSVRRLPRISNRRGDARAFPIWCLWLTPGITPNPSRHTCICANIAEMAVPRLRCLRSIISPVLFRGGGYTRAVVRLRLPSG